MPQLTSGARSILNDIAATLDDIDRARQLAYQVAVGNPHRAQDEQVKIGGLTDKVRYQLRSLEPLLERQAPQLEQRVAALEEKLREIEEGKRVIPFRREA